METTLENALTITVVGFITVFSVLLFFAIIISCINQIDKIITNRKNKQQTKPVLQTNVNETNTVNENESIVPIIAAAVHSTVGENAVIRKITFAHDMQTDTSWSRVSRGVKQVDSHNIQTTRRIYGR